MTIRAPKPQHALRALLASATALLSAGLGASCTLDSAGTLTSSGGGPTSSGNGGSGGEGNTTSGTGGVGAQGGQAPECTSSTTCPGSDTQCGHRTCDGGICGYLLEPEGTLCTANGGDSCDGAGACLKDQGTVCAGGVECHSGICTDARCCDLVCDGPCIACDIAGLQGTCSPHAPATDPEGLCDGVCSGVGDCVTGAHAWEVAPVTDNGFDDRGWEVAVDAISGAVIIDGDMWGAVDLGGGPLTYNGGDDAWVAKLDAAGNHVWSYSFGGTGDQSPYGLAVDASGNIFVDGWFEGSLAFGGTAPPLTATGVDGDVFVVKLDPDGSGLWARHFDDFSPGADDPKVAYELATTSGGDVLVLGHFAGSISFGGSWDFTTAANHDVFLARLDGDTGTVMWASHFSGNAEDYGYSVAVNATDEVFITGEFASSNFDISPTPLDSGAIDLYVAKIDVGTGVPVWAKHFGDGATQRGTGIATRSDGGVVVVGEFAGTLNLGDGHSITALNGVDGFVATFDGAGTATGLIRLGGNNFQSVRRVAVDSDDQVVVTGDFLDEVNLGAGLLDATNAQDIFLARYDENLLYLWGKVFGGTGDAIHRGVALGPAGQIYTTGWFSSTLDLGAGAMTSGADDDVFVGAFAP